MILEVTLNLDVPDGLYHGAWGHLRAIELQTGPPEILWMEFVDSRVGVHARSLRSSLFANRPLISKNFVPLFRTSRSFNATGREDSTILRWQFPVKPATASTFHHSEGLTLDEGAVDFRGPKRFPKMAGRHYVGYSRFREPENKLFVLDSAHEEIHVDPRVHSEMARLRQITRAPLSIAELPLTNDLSEHVFLISTTVGAYALICQTFVVTRTCCVLTFFCLRKLS